MAQFKFWFYDKDKNGQPLDDNILKTAEEIAPLLTRYRKQEIECESICNEILQDAIEAVSHAASKNPIANPAGYLVSVYKRSVDKFLDHKHRLIPLGDEFLEGLVNSGSTQPSSEEWIHNRLVLEKLLKLMDAETRQICMWRLEGYSESQIAKSLGISPNTVCVRFTRGLKEAAKTLFGGKGTRQNK